MAEAQKPTPQSPTDAELQRLYALDRTVLANERTYAAWIRTGLAALVGGLAVEHILADGKNFGLLHSIGALLILFSAISFLLASWRYKHLGIRLVALDVRIIPTRLTSVIGLLLALCSFLALITLIRAHL